MTHAARLPLDDDALSVAIIGLACRYPGAQDDGAFWANLRGGTDSVRRFSRDELRRVLPTALIDRPNFVAASGYLEGADCFDASFFGISDREAEFLDPQHRLFLECAWHALEDACCPPNTFAGTIGCYASAGMSLYSGASLSSYFRANVEPSAGYPGAITPPQAVIAHRSDYLPQRVAYKFGLRGPAINVQTACSSSLVAVHLACQAVLNGDCDVALAGGAAVHIPLESGYVYEPTGILSPTGQCRAFDAAAKGVVGGNGVGVVVLKRLDDARAAGDSIRAIIRGSAINNDGNGKVSFSAPSVEGQIAVIARALRVAGVQPDTIGHIEAHGTGTVLGDPVEVASLTEVYRRYTDRRGYCAIGSVKTNIGHLDTAAGVAGLIKTVLLLEHGEIPPTLNFESPNPAIDFAASPFYVPVERRTWPDGLGPVRRAAVSSFGAGGTNAHAILEQAPDLPREPMAESPMPSVFPVSARTDNTLETLLQNLEQASTDKDSAWLADAAFTLAVGRTHFKERRAALIASDQHEFRQAVHCFLTQAPRRNETIQPVFVVPAWSEFILAAIVLFHRCSPAFRAAFDACVESAVGCRMELHASKHAWLSADPDRREIAYLAFCRAAAVMWDSWGVHARRFIAEKDARIAAACAAGVLDVVGGRQVALALEVWRRNRDLAEFEAAMAPIHQGRSGLPLDPEYWSEAGDLVLLDPVGLAANERQFRLCPQSSRADEKELWRGLLDSLATLYCAGAEINWRNVHAGTNCRYVRLPKYSFERNRHWIDPPAPQGCDPASAAIYDLAWDAVAADAKPAGVVDQRPWLVLAGETYGEELAAALRSQGRRVVLRSDLNATLADALRRVPEGFGAIAYLRGLDLDGDVCPTAQRQTCRDLQLLAASLAFEGSPPIQIAIVTAGAVAAAAGDRVSNPQQAILWGIARAAATEFPTIGWRCLDLDRQDAVAMAEMLLGSSEPEIALRGDRWFRPSLRPSRTADLRVPPAIRRDGTYLLTGGSGGIGLAVAHWLIDAGAAAVALASRGPIDPSALQQLRDHASPTQKVIAYRADISDQAAVSSLLGLIRSKLPALRGVFHCAGVVHDELLAASDHDRMAAVLAPKVRGGWLLHEQTRDDPLDLFVLFSSAAALFGSPGQASYAGANAYLGALAARRRAEGLPALCIHWGPWAKVGMTARMLARGRLHNAHRELLAIEPRDALAAMRRAMTLPAVEQAILALDPARLGRALGEGMRLTEIGTHLWNLTPRGAGIAGHGPANIEAAVASIIREVTGSDPDRHRAFAEMGIDSLAAIGLAARLSATFERPFPATLLFKFQSISALAEHLADQRPPSPKMAEVAAASPGSPRVAAPTVAKAEPALHNEENGHVQQEPIAIVEMACRFPGVADPDALWQAFVRGTDATGPLPRDRFKLGDLYDSEVGAKGKVYTRQGAFLADFDSFDAQFFGISPREAQAMDPQHRLLLETCWEALERAAIPTADLKESETSLFVGLCSDDYGQLSINRDNRDEFDAHASIGTSRSVAAGRVAYLLGLQGPAVQLDTSCSSSLVAVHLACQSLRADECDLALAGGVHLNLSPLGLIARCQIRALSPDGRCKTFDAAADGFGLGEGCGIVVLKRLSDALQDGSSIVAVIRGSAVNHNGFSNGLTAPNERAQSKVIRRALAAAGVAGEDVGFVEAHGTGTELGDPIEVAAIADALCERRPATRPVLIGSAKTNFGHTEAAAGVLSLMKAALAVRNGLVPGNLNFTTPNPHIPWARLPIAVPVEPTPWPAHNAERIAGVSSFGLNGTNAHVILGMAPSTADAQPAQRSSILTISARSPAALDEQRARYAELLERSNGSFEDICYTSNISRSRHDHRLALVAASAAEAAAALREPTTRRVESGIARRGRPAVVFLFSGQGTQYPAMGWNAYLHEPAFRKAFDLCDFQFRLRLGVSPRDAILPRASQSNLARTLHAQAAIFSIQYSLVALWRRFGIEPDVVLGHSIGEYAAACAASVMSLEQAVGLVAARASAMDRIQAGGQMLAAECDEALALDVLAPYRDRASIAAINTPTQTVLSGAAEELCDIKQALEERGVRSRYLAVSHAFHSPLMAPAAEVFRRSVAIAGLTEPRSSFVSSVTGTTESEALTSAEYWVRQICEPVRFQDAVRNAATRAEMIFLEIGPGHSLLTLARLCVAEPHRHSWLPSLAQDDPDTVPRALAALYALGAPVDWQGVHGNHRRRRVVLPTYPFQRQRCWSELVEDEMRRFYSGPLTPGVSQTVPAPADATTVTKLVRDVVAEIFHLRADAIPYDVPLLELGADSFMIAAVIAVLKSRSGVQLSVRELFGELATVEAIAARIAGDTHSTGATLQAAEPRVPMPRVAQPDLQIRASRKSVAPPMSMAPVATFSDAPAGATLLPERLAAPRREPVVDAQPRIRAPLSQQQEDYLARFVEAYTARTRASRDRRASADWLCRRSVEFGFRMETKDLFYPIVAKRAAGARFWDLDDNEYIDLAMGFGALLFGHSPRFLDEALRAQLEAGFAVAPESEHAAQVAKWVCELGGMDRALFTTSGTEAVMTALRLARAATGRFTVVIFRNAFHGHFDGTLASQTEDGTTRPMALGTPPGMVEDVVVLGFAEPTALERLRALGKKVAAVLIEPVQSRRPDLQDREFLRALRRATVELGAVLIFDEIFHGFRIHQGGLQAWAAVDADMVTYGKALANGLPVGVVAGKSWCMARADGGAWSYGDLSYPQTEPSFTAGTFAKHPLTMAAAHAVLTEMRRLGPGLQEELNARTARLAARLNRQFARLGVALKVHHFGSYFRFAVGENLTFFHEYQPLDLDLFFYHLCYKGIYIWEGRTCFLSTAHSDADNDRIVEAAVSAVEEMQQEGFWRSASIGIAPLRRQPELAAPAVKRNPESPLPAPAVMPAPAFVPRASSCSPNFSLYFFGDYPAEYSDEKYDVLFEGARLAEEAGFEAVWIPERHFHSMGGFSPNPSVLAAALASRTDRVAIRGSVVSPLHHPVRLAEEWSLVDNISRGRVGLAFASGWQRDDFVLSPDAWERRREITLQALNTVQRLWRGEQVELPGVNGLKVGCRLHPLPRQAELPAWIVSLGSSHTVEAAGKSGVNLLTNLIGQSVDELARAIALYRRSREQIGHDPAGGRVTLLLHTLLGSDRDVIRAQARTPLRAYLRSSLALYGRMVEGDTGREYLGPIRTDDETFLIDKAVDRYLESAGLIGDAEHCAGIVAAVAAAGVDEIACFVDFGVPRALYSDGLHRLAEFRAGLASKSTGTRTYRPFVSAPIIERKPDTSGARRHQYATSSDQRLLWLLSTLNSQASAAFNQATTLEITGALDIAALRRAISRTVARHDALRTRLSADGETQVLWTAASIEVDCIDLTAEGIDTSEPSIDRLVLERMSTPFDLSSALHRFAILRLAPDRHLLAAALHLIMCDGVSLGVVFRDIELLYNEEVTGRSADLPEPLQFEEYLACRERLMNSPEFLRQRAFWEERLAAPLPRIELPTKSIRAAQRSYRGARITERIPRAVAEKLRDRSRAWSCTQFMTLLAVFVALLHRESQQNEFAIGIAFAGRNSIPESDSTVGFCSNLLPLHCRINAEARFDEHLESLRASVLCLYENQDYPLAGLMCPALRHQPGGAPALPVVFNWDRYSLPDFHELDVRYRPQPIINASRELMPTVFDVNEELVITWDHDADLFEPAYVQAFAKRFRQFLDCVLDRPSCRLLDLPLLLPDELRHLSSARSTSPAVEATVPSMFEEQAARTPEAIAVEDDRQSLTFAALNARANQIAAWLGSVGVKPEHPVGLLTDRSADALAAILGILKAGGAYVAPVTDAPQALRDSLLVDSGVRALITAESLSEHYPELPVLNLDELSARKRTFVQPTGVVSPRQLAYILYTSGSTDRPKGVMVEHRSLIQLHRALHERIYFEQRASLRIAMNGALSFDTSVKQWLMLLSGHTLVTIPREIRADPAAFLEYLNEYHVDVLDATPSHLRALLDAEQIDHPRRYLPPIVLCAGDAIDGTLWRRLARHPRTCFYNLYGPTECTVDVTACRVAGEEPNIGSALPGMSTYVLDEQMRAVPDGSPGELFIGGIGVARGYCRRPDLTALSFNPDMFMEAGGARLYRTGDRVRQRRDGALVFIGRCDDQVKVRGHRVELSEIRDALITHPRIADAAVLLADDSRVAAFWTSYQDADIPAAEVAAFLRKRLPEFMVPTLFQQVDTLPRSNNWKLDRTALRLKPGTFVNNATRYDASSLEPEVVAIYREIVGNDTITAEEDFFMVGGHSLLVARLAATLVRRLNAKLPLRDLFKYTTPRALAQELERRRHLSSGGESND